MGRLRKIFWSISEREVDSERRGFRLTEPGIREHLERIGRTFVRGYGAALEVDRPAPLAARLEEVPAALRGFAYEGAAMALALADLIMPWRRRVAELLEGPGSDHTYLVHVGTGWALARVPLPAGRLVSGLDPVQRWLALDGWGFHQGYFHPREAVREARWPKRLSHSPFGAGESASGDYARRAFDQGLGRSLWFVEGARVESIAETLGSFSPERREDLWSGVGLAATYAGGVGQASLARLRKLAGEHRPALAQGAIFAAEARHRAGNLTPATESACGLLFGGEVAEAVGWSRAAGQDLPPDTPGRPAFEAWRRRLQNRWRDEKEGQGGGVGRGVETPVAVGASQGPDGVVRHRGDASEMGER